MSNKWPLQKDCISFYGNPRSLNFERDNIIAIKLPWAAYYGNSLVSRVSVHKKCAEAFLQWFDIVWTNAEKRQATIDAWGMSQYSGGFVVRVKRAGSTLSMHSYGCALDFDAPRNPFRVTNPRFAIPAIQENVVEPFKKLGGTWGGDWHPPDGMHFQFATVR